MTMPPENVSPSLREFLEQQLDYERKILDQRIELFEKTQRVRDTARDRELQLQAIEYERRLTALNHAAERAVAEAGRVVSRIEWDEFKKTYDETKIANAKELQGIASRAATWTAAIAIGFAILNIIIRFWPTPMSIR